MQNLVYLQGIDIFADTEVGGQNIFLLAIELYRDACQRITWQNVIFHLCSRAAGYPEWVWLVSRTLPGLGIGNRLANIDDAIIGFHISEILVIDEQNAIVSQIEFVGDGRQRVAFLDV